MNMTQRNDLEIECCQNCEFALEDIDDERFICSQTMNIVYWNGKCEEWEKWNRRK
jgi:hypothetical protein